MARYITETAGMHPALIELMDGLLPILPGQPEDYIMAGGRPDIDRIITGVQPHSDTTGHAARLIITTWQGGNDLARLFGHADRHNRTVLANALHQFAYAVEESINA